MRLLVAEDEQDLNRLIRKTLEKEGYGVDSCFDGEEALYYLENTDYDGAILDIMMPKKDGLFVLKALRQKGSDLPVLFLTALSGHSCMPHNGFYTIRHTDVKFMSWNRAFINFEISA